MPVGMGGSALASAKTDPFVVVQQSEFTAPRTFLRSRIPRFSWAEIFFLPLISCYSVDKLLPSTRRENVLAISFTITTPKLLPSTQPCGKQSTHATSHFPSRYTPFQPR